MRLPLRTQLVLIAAVPIATLAIAALATVNQSIHQRVELGVRDDLRRASEVFESMLAARARTLETETEIIAQDPKFFAVLTLPGREGDPQIAATVAGVARDFNAIAEADLFEVLDRDGHTLASAGRESLSDASAMAMARAALGGRPQGGVASESGALYQVSATPVFAGGRLVGALLLGSRIGSDLAARLQAFTRSEVTFFASGEPAASTLEEPASRAALATVVREQMGAGHETPGTATVLEVKTPRNAYLTLIRPLPRSHMSEMFSYAMQRSLREETAFLRDMQRGLILLGLIALAVAVLAGWLISERILAPVHQLVRSAEAMERGDYEYPLDIGRGDEIGYLATRFGEMRQRQRAYVKSLKEAARAKSEFISLASHELRTPISVIKGFQELMLGGHMGPVSNDQREALEAIQRSVGSLTRVAENATRMAQIQDERFELVLGDVDVAELAGEAIAAAREAAPRRAVGLSFRTEKTLPVLRADRDRLALALHHLLTNGIRFTPDGGFVELVLRRPDGELVVEVRDNGVGIAEDRQQGLFERGAAGHEVDHHHSSNQLEFNSAGLGLGLAIARGVVEAHGGRLTVESTPGRGSTFRMHLPLPEATAARAA